MKSMGRALSCGVAPAICAVLFACGGGGGGGTSVEPHRSLTVTKVGSGGGTVGSSPAGIDCGPTCIGTYANGTAVTLTAAADASSAFTGWSGACNGTGACVVSMSGDRAVIASFTPGESTCETPGGRLFRGPYIVANDTNVNSEVQLPAHPIDDFSQCASLQEGTIPGTLKASWSWSWPHPAVPAESVSRATPTIIYGFKPWDRESTTASLPRLVSDVGSLTVDADVVQSVGAGQVSNFGVLTYLTTANQRSGGSLPIARRFFIYRNSYPASSGTPTASEISIDGISWDVQSDSDYVVYYPHADMDVPAAALHVDVAHFLEDALSRGMIDASWYVSSVETGAILDEGEGSLTLDNYRVVVHARAPSVGLDFESGQIAAWAAESDLVATGGETSLPLADVTFIEDRVNFQAGSASLRITAPMEKNYWGTDYLTDVWAYLQRDRTAVDFTGRTLSVYFHLGEGTETVDTLEVQLLDSSTSPLQGLYTVKTGDAWQLVTFTPCAKAGDSGCDPENYRGEYFDITRVQSIILRISNPIGPVSQATWNLDSISW